jgi:hypothetical protein
VNFLERAKYTASKGIPVIRVRPNAKAAMDNAWPELATTDVEVLNKWNEETPTANCAAVARAEIGGFWFLELDAAAEITKRIQEETGKEIPDTFRVRSRQNRGHLYWKHTPASIAAGNISQSYVRHADWSARMNNGYVVSAFSLHPNSQEPYTPLREEAIIACPDWLVAWLVSQKVSPKSTVIAGPPDVLSLVPHGEIHGFMLHHAGKLRNQGLSVEAIEVALLDLVHKFCAPPIDDTKVRNMARSVGKYEPGQSGEILFTQQPSPITQLQETIELPTFENEPYPTFPTWVMKGTSIYENFVKPVCDHNSRIDYFMWIPAMTMLMNYVGPKIKLKAMVGSSPYNGAIYEVLIGKAGKANKSSCVDDAKSYFNYMGCLMQSSDDVKNADGKTLTITVGSAEGLGTKMQKSNCKNVLLDYDELSNLVSKVGIESSSLASALLLLYEAKAFGNSVKGGKESFAIAPNTYCCSLICNTTTAKFPELWSKLAGKDSGLDDRFMFVLEPEILPKTRLFKFINTVEAAQKTKVLIDKAIQQEVFDFESWEDNALLNELNEKSNRFALRAQRWAVGIAIDLGLPLVDNDCIERGVEIVKYEIAVKKYLKSYEALTREAEIQLGIHRMLEMNKGRMLKTDLKRNMNAARYGTALWNQSYKGSMNDGVFREEGAGTKGDPIYLQLLRKREMFDE